MATRKQAKAIGILLANTGVSTAQAMRTAGYAETSARNPHYLTRSPAFAELAERFLPDRKLLKVSKQGLEATKKRAEIVGRDSKGNPEYEYVDEVDHYARHQFLQTALKIRGLAQTTDVPVGDINIQVINYADTSDKNKKMAEVSGADTPPARRVSLS